LHLLRLTLLLCILFLPALAQVDRATLTGTVTDPSGAVVSGVSIQAESETTGLRRQTLSSNSGTFSFAALPIGVYTLTASHPGFNTATANNIRLGVGETRTLDLALAISGTFTTVTVESTVAALDRESPAIGTVITSTQAREMPLNGRHWASLMALAPGAINSGDGSQQTIRFVGRARDDNNWTLDGLDATGVKDPRQEGALRLVISTDSIAEFRVNSTLYSAESGGGAGAQINVVTKGGTNEFHGSLFEFLRDDKMDARNPFDTSKQPFRLNQFGGNFGGPIVKNKTFFFVNYEGLRQRVSQTTRNDVPSAAFRARATDVNVRRILDAYPLGTEATSSADIDRVLAVTTNVWREDAGTARFDHRFNDNNGIFVRYNIDDGTVVSPRSVVAGDRQESLFRPSNMVLQYQRIFSPSVVNEIKAGFNRSALNRFNYAPFEESIAVAGFQTLNNSNLQVETGTSYSLIDNLAITRGRHTIKVGGEIRRAHVNVADPARDALAVTYASRNDLLANRVDRVAITGGNDVLGTRKWYYFAYVQDDWKVLSNLTLNLGLRYEYYGVNREVNDRYRVFDFYECRGFCAHGTPWYFPDRNNFDPRIGLSWSLFDGKTVIRTGGGLYHGPGQIDDQNSPLDNMSDNYTLTRVEAPTLSYPVVPFLSLARSVGLTPRSLQRDRRDLYSGQWGLSIQQQLPVQFTMQVGYVGSSASNVTTRSDLNVLDPVTRTRPLPTFNRIDEKRNDGNSNFNALQVSLHRRMGRGFQWGTEYMWSHSINDGATGGGEGLQIMNVACRACDRGNSASDIRHTITSNWVYELPFGRGKRYLSSGPASAVFGNWEASGIWTMRTGRPLNITVNRSANDLPDGNSRTPRPDLVSGAAVYPSTRTFGNWLNIGAFAVPASRTWGNLGRHMFRGPGLAQVDLALSKRIRFNDTRELVLRGEGFNLFNRTQAGDPGTNISAPGSFGVVTSGLNRSIGTGTSRQLQVALRFNF
jgi:outer membrane receptor protein involved in Fe transport